MIRLTLLQLTFFSEELVFLSRPLKGGATRAAGGLGFVDGRVPGKAGFYNKGWVTEFNKKNW